MLQVLTDCDISGLDGGYRILGVGELLTVPAHQALKMLCLAPEHFRIMKPTPLLPGVAVRWLLPDDSSLGPGIVQLLDGEPPNRQLSVLLDGELRWIHERDVFDIDVWPAIDVKLEKAVDLFLSYGEESPKFIEIQEWVLANFSEE